MQILGNLKADRLINQIVAAGSLKQAKSSQAVDKLQDVGRPAVPKLLAHVRNGVKQESDLIVDLLALLVSKNTYDLYLQALTDQDARVVAAVAQALSRQRHVDTNRLLALMDNPAASKPAVLEVLTAHRERLNPRLLLRYAYNLDRSDQASLFRLIADSADDGLVPELISRVNAKQPSVRAHIARVLTRCNTEESRATLQELLSDPDKNVRFVALDGLLGMSAELDVERIAQLLKDPDLRVQEKAVEALIELNHPRTVSYLLDPLRDESEYVRRAAVEVLNVVGDARAIKDLFFAIKDSDWWVRSRAADALGNIGGPRVVDAVIQLLRDDDEFIRRTAIEIINATQDERSFDGLLAALEDSDWWVRERAIDGLAALGNKQAAPVLLKMLDASESDEAQTLVLIRALAQLGSSAAVESILGCLQSGSDEVKKEALQALEKLVDEPHAPAAMKTISKAVELAGFEVKQLATEVLEELNTRFLTRRSRSGRTQAVQSSAKVSQTGALAMPGTITRGASSLSSAHIDPSQLEPDDVLANRYRYLRQIGRGAFGSVCLFEDLVIKEEIILKFLNMQVAQDQSVIKRFVHELRFARKVTHENVIRLFDMITFGSTSAIAMEYFPSHSLNEELTEGKPMDMERALMIVCKVCAGMSAAHQTEVVHRDLKPGNILIDEEDRVKIVDFGVAAATRQLETRLTKTGLLVGTPTYMAPEQILGREVDARTDIYSLGVILYEMLTGRPPYSGADSMAVMYQHVQGKVESPRKLNSELPHTFSAVIMKMMADKPEKRFQTMEELKRRLDAFAG